MPISFVRAATSPSLSIRFKESVPFLSAARRTQEFAVWIDYEAFDYDTHQLTPGGPARLLQPRLGLKIPLIFRSRSASCFRPFSVPFKHVFPFSFPLQSLSLASTHSVRCPMCPHPSLIHALRW